MTIIIALKKENLLIRAIKFFCLLYIIFKVVILLLNKYSVFNVFEENNKIKIENLQTQ